MAEDLGEEDIVRLVFPELNKLGAALVATPEIDKIVQAAQDLTRGGCWTPQMLATLWV